MTSETANNWTQSFAKINVSPGNEATQEALHKELLAVFLERNINESDALNMLLNEVEALIQFLTPDEEERYQLTLKVCDRLEKGIDPFKE
jgi:hypothetical protein